MILLMGLAFGLALPHIVAGKLRFLAVIPRSRWLSLAGGISVAYVFVHLLPELAGHQRTIEAMGGLGGDWLKQHVYLMALVGLSVFYGVERAVKSSRQNRPFDSETSPQIFWLHMSSFAVYNALIGYLLLHREQPGLRSLLLYFTAMALHFVVNDYGLRVDHKEAYDRIGRWLLSGAVLVGFVLGLAIEIHRGAIAVLFAFLAGGVVLNVLKEELPEERGSRFWPFAAGAAGYAALLLLT